MSVLQQSIENLVYNLFSAGMWAVNDLYNENRLLPFDTLWKLGDRLR